MIVAVLSIVHAPFLQGHETQSLFVAALGEWVAHAWRRRGFPARSFVLWQAIRHLWQSFCSGLSCLSLDIRVI